jgi:predicted TIM-barrel fold metal-dependent hydrolase
VWLADLSDADQQAIFGGNAARILSVEKELVAPTVAPAPPALPQRIFDAHAHFGLFNLPTPEVGVAETEAAMEKYNMERCVLSSWLGICYDYIEGNRQVQKAIDGHPSLLGYVVVDPNDLSGSCAEMDRCFRLDNFAGVKLHCQHARQPTSSMAVRTLVAEVARRGRPLLIHIYGPDYVAALLELARTHPELKMIVAHSGPGWPDPALFPAAAQVDNLYLDFCTTYPWRGAVRAALDIVGVDRILFGSDFPIIDPGYMLGHYLDADLSAAEQEKILYANAFNLFGR